MRMIVRAVIAFMASMSALAPAMAAELKVEYAELAGVVRTLSQGAKVHIHNAPAQGLLFLVGGVQSHVELAGHQAPIDVPTEDGWAPVIGSYSYYVNNLDLTKLTVGEAPGAIRITMAFDGSGYKMVPSDDRLPSVAWSNPSISIDMRPIKAGGSIALEAVRVKVEGSLRAECTRKGVFCTYIALQEAKKKVKSLPGQISAQIKDVINSPGVRESFAKSLQSYLTLGSLGQVKINGIRSSDKSVTISFCLQGC